MILINILISIQLKVIRIFINIQLIILMIRIYTCDIA